MPATLKQLVNVRSRLVEEVLAFLRQLADLLDATPWVRRGGERIRASDIAIELFVLTKEERARVPRRGREGEEPDAIMERRSPMEEIEAARYELPARMEEREEVRWRQMVRRGRARLGVKGAPGSGKTFTTRHTMAELAWSAAEKLDRHEVGVEEIEAPVWVTAKMLAQASARNVEEALVEALENTFPELRLAPNVRWWLQRAIGSLRAFVVVDALDELEERDRAGFEANARRLDSLSGRVMVTCRTMHWEERKGWLGWSKVVEVELAPLKQRQQREFGRKFFGQRDNESMGQLVNEGNSELARSMERLLQVNFALRHACTTPLLLTFGCLLHEDGKVKEDTTYAQLYADIRRKLVCGEWRSSNAPKPDWVGNGVQEEKRFRLLEGIAWGLFSKAPHLNRFTLDDWEQAADEAEKEGRAAPVDPADFLERLEQVGFVVPAGFDEQRRDRCWSFVHRTLLEFCAACALSRMKRDVWLNEAKQHFWFQPEWLEVLTFLAGLVDDATPLIEAVEEVQEEDDVFGSMVCLKARLTGAAANVNEGTVWRVSSDAFSFWHDTLISRKDSFRGFGLQMFALLITNVLARRILTTTVLKLAHNDNWRVRMAAAEALSRLDDERALEMLFEFKWDWEENNYNMGTVVGETLRNFSLEKLMSLVRDKDPFVREAAAEAVGYHVGGRAVELLLEMTRDKEMSVRRAAVVGLGRIGSEKAVERLLELSEDENKAVTCAAAFELALMEVGQGMSRLLELTRDETPFIRHEAAEALGRLCREGERLIELTFDPDEWVRMAAAKGLGNIGGDRAIERLLDLIRDEDWNVRNAAATALKRIIDERWIERLLELALDDDGWVRAVVAEILADVGDKRGVQRLLELALDRDRRACEAAVAALSKLGNKRAVKVLLELSLNEDEYLRRQAAFALGKLGNKQGVEVLLALTRDEDYVRWPAATGLGDIGDKRAIPTLLELIQDDYWRVRRAAVKALWQIAWKHRMPIRA